jgi:hypothetical protein
MEVTSRCPHARRTVFNGWELLRKYECEDCGAIATCLCDKAIAQYVVPHQAMAARDPESNQHVAVTDPLAENLCHACRGERPPAFPRIAHRGAATVIHRFNWWEMHREVQQSFLAWCQEQGLALLGENGRPLIGYLAKEHPAEYDAYQRSVLEKYRAIHAADPLYDTARESDVDLLARHHVPVEEVRAWYVTPTQGRVLVAPEGSTEPNDAVGVEEYVARRLRGTGREVLFCESKPFHTLFATLMWPWVSDIIDPLLEPHGFGGRDGIGADERGLIWIMMSGDFGKPHHAIRRRDALDRHLATIPDDPDDLREMFDICLEGSRGLRQYLWVYTDDDAKQARDLLAVIPPNDLKTILRYLAGDYWHRYLGWPDLLTWRNSPQGPGDLLFVEVKSSSDKLAEDQRSWIEGNTVHLKFSFRVVKVHRTGRLTAADQ